MKSSVVGIVNYGIGNLKSLQNALEASNCSVKVIDEPTQFNSCTHLVLPGVGAFGSAMAAMNRKFMIEPLLNKVAGGDPVLGICLGMQLFFQASEEGGKFSGLKIFSGTVQKLRCIKGSKSLHTQWNRVQHQKLANDRSTNSNYYYFTHRYAIYDVDEQEFDHIGLTEFSDHKFLSFANKENITLTQFHPENSGDVGLKFLENFTR